MVYNLPKIQKLAQDNETDPQDSEILSAAQKIYDVYYRLHSKVPREPLGVAINPKTGRGQLLFTKKPLLLPGEYFIPVKLLQESKTRDRY